MKGFMNRWGLVLVLCFTLGLAPFFPEPHLVGKLRWIWGGAQGMKAIDWFDLVLHSTPWLWAVGIGVGELKSQAKRNKAHP